MRVFCLADEDTVRGFRLAGVAGESVATPAEAAAVLAREAARPDAGVLLLTESVAASLRDIVDELRWTRSRPLIVEIPGPAGPLPGRRSLRQLVQEAVGLHVGT